MHCSVCIDTYNVAPGPIDKIFSIIMRILYTNGIKIQISNSPTSCFEFSFVPLIVILKIFL
jgi:hypothetical protein